MNEEQARPRVQVIVQGPPQCGKSAIATTIGLAMGYSGVQTRYADANFAELPAAHRQNVTQVSRPIVSIVERTDKVAFARAAEEFLQVGRHIAAENTSEAKQVLAEQIGKMEAALQEMRSWELVQS